MAACAAREHEEEVAIAGILNNCAINRVARSIADDFAASAEELSVRNELSKKSWGHLWDDTSIPELKRESEKVLLDKLLGCSAGARLQAMAYLRRRFGRKPDYDWSLPQYEHPKPYLLGLHNFEVVGGDVHLYAPNISRPIPSPWDGPSFDIRDLASWAMKAVELSAHTNNDLVSINFSRGCVFGALAWMLLVIYLPYHVDVPQGRTWGLSPRLYDVFRAAPWWTSLIAKFTSGLTTMLQALHFSS